MVEYMQHAQLCLECHDHGHNRHRPAWLSICNMRCTSPLVNVAAAFSNAVACFGAWDLSCSACCKKLHHQRNMQNTKGGKAISLG